MFLWVHLRGRADLLDLATEFETIDDSEQDSDYTGRSVDRESPRTPASTCTTTATSPSISSSGLSPPSSPRSDDSDFAPALASATSHGRKKKAGHIPRPSNAFIIFRSELWKFDVGSGGAEQDHRQISRIAGIRWKQLDEETKEEYRRRAREAKAEHERMYPGYKYAPTGKRKVKKRKSKQDAERELARARLISDLISQGLKRADLEKALSAIDQAKLEEHLALTSRSARTTKVPARSARQASRSRLRLPKEPSSATPLITISSPSALGLDLSGSPDATISQPGPAIPEFAPPCSTLDQNDTQSGQTDSHKPWNQQGFAEPLLGTQAGDLSPVEMPYPATQATYDAAYENGLMKGPVSPLPLYTSLDGMPPSIQQYSPLQCVSPLHGSPLHHLSASPQFLTSPLQPFPSLLSTDGQSIGSPYNMSSPLSSSSSPIGTPEDFSSLSPAGHTLGSPASVFDSMGFASTVPSSDGLGLYHDSYSVSSSDATCYSPEPNFAEWINL